MGKMAHKTAHDTMDNKDRIRLIETLVGVERFKGSEVDQIYYFAFNDPDDEQSWDHCNDLFVPREWSDENVIVELEKRCRLFGGVTRVTPTRETRTIKSDSPKHAVMPQIKKFCALCGIELGKSRGTIQLYHALYPPSECPCKACKRRDDASSSHAMCGRCCNNAKCRLNDQLMSFSCKTANAVPREMGKKELCECGRWKDHYCLEHDVRVCKLCIVEHYLKVHQ